MMNEVRPLLASSPRTWAIGDKESEKSSNEEAFYNLFGWHTLHQPALGEIEKEESNHSAHDDSSNSCFKPGRAYCTSHPGSLWFYIKLFELHIYKYVDKQICKSNLFLFIAI